MPGGSDKEKPVDPDKERPPADQGAPAKPAAPPPKPGIPPETKPREPVAATKHKETGGPKGLEPTRYQDWERGGRCIDF
jgi:hypothetical protein